MVRDLVKRAVRRLVAGSPRVPGAPPSGRAPPTRVEPPAPPPDEEAPADLEVEGSQVADMVSRGDPMLLIDIREPHELRQGHGRGALLLPMNEVPQRLAELPRDQTLVVYCAAGARSWGVAHYLREQGFPLAVSLGGGFADLVDATGEWEQPLPGNPQLLQVVGLAPVAAAQAGVEPGAQATVQSVQVVDEQTIVAVWVPRAGGLPGVRLEGLSPDALELG